MLSTLFVLNVNPLNEVGSINSDLAYGLFSSFENTLLRYIFDGSYSAFLLWRTTRFSLFYEDFYDFFEGV